MSLLCHKMLNGFPMPIKIKSQITWPGFEGPSSLAPQWLPQPDFLPFHPCLNQLYHPGVPYFIHVLNVPGAFPFQGLSSGHSFPCKASQTSPMPLSQALQETSLPFLSLSRLSPILVFNPVPPFRFIWP